MEKQPQTPIAVDRLVTIGVDIQNDFITGSLAVNEGAEVVRPMNDVMHYTREQDGVVTLTRDWHPESTAHFDTWPVHCVEQTEGAALHPELDQQPEDIIISKGTSQIDDGYSGFEGQADDGTTLEQLIQPKTLRERVGVLIGGLATDFCVKATMLDGIREFKDTPNVHFALIQDAVRGVDLQPGDSEKALQEMATNGAIFTQSEAVLANEVFVVERNN